MSSKVISPSAAANLIRSNDTVTIAGFVGVGVPDEILAALKRVVLKHRHRTI